MPVAFSQYELSQQQQEENSARWQRNINVNTTTGVTIMLCLALSENRPSDRFLLQRSNLLLGHYGDMENILPRLRYSPWCDRALLKPSENLIST